MTQRYPNDNLSALNKLALKLNVSSDNITPCKQWIRNVYKKTNDWEFIKYGGQGDVSGLEAFLEAQKRYNYWPGFLNQKNWFCIVEEMKTECNKEVYEREIAQEWFEEGKLKHDDYFMVFITHWIAFNWYYDGCDGFYERDRIISFCNKNHEVLNQYDPDEKDHELFMALMESRVKNMDRRYGQRGSWDAYKKIHSEDLEQRLEGIFLTLYQIRCNLFHGSKSLRIQRDVELVRASSVLLENYMDVFIQSRQRRN